MYTTSYKTCPFGGIDLESGIVGLMAVPMKNSACEPAVVPILPS